MLKHYNDSVSRIGLNARKITDPNSDGSDRSLEPSPGTRSIRFRASTTPAGVARLQRFSRPWGGKGAPFNTHTSSCPPFSLFRCSISFWFSSLSLL